MVVTVPGRTVFHVYEPTSIHALQSNLCAQTAELSQMPLSFLEYMYMYKWVSS